ncbi:MAG: DUF1559 domain-containing protein, partial [Patescibacteria group bacterium]|nr:DUF1559 domain-containing protein [Patescibacteria group bacterium]
LRLWQVVLDRPVTGKLTLALDFGQTFSALAADEPARDEVAGEEAAGETAFAGAGSPVPVPVLIVRNVSRQTGKVAIEAASDQQILCESDNLRELDPADVPQPAAYAPRQRIVAAYQYSRLPYGLTVSAVRFSSASLIGAVCETAEILSVVGEHGRTRHQARFMVRTQHQQDVPVTLPEDADLWAVLLDNDPVEVRRQDGAYLVSIPAGQATDASLFRELAFVYETAARDGNSSGVPGRLLPCTVRYDAPQIAMPTLFTTWAMVPLEGTDWVSTGGSFRTDAPPSGPALAASLARRIARPSLSGLKWKVAGLIAAGIVAGAYALSTPRKTAGATLVELAVAVMVILILIALLLPATQSAREAARRTTCLNNLRQITLALHNYEAVHRQFPPAVIGPSNVPRERQFSWMVAILPYLEQQDIYDALRLDLPWDSPHNAPLLENLKVSTFRCPSDPQLESFQTKTGYVAITGAVSAPGLRATRGVIGFDRSLQ